MSQIINKLFKKSKKRRKTERRLQLEKLDGRQMMAADLGVSLEEGVLSIDGSDQSDYVDVQYSEDGQQVILKVNDQEPQSFDSADVESIQFEGGAGNDTFVNQTAIPSEAHGGEGSDFLFGGAANDRLEGGEGEDFVFGGPGDDVLVGDPTQDQLHGGDGEDKVVATEEQEVEDSVSDKVKEAVDAKAKEHADKLAELEAEEQAAIDAANKQAEHDLETADAEQDAAIANVTEEFDGAVGAEQKKLNEQHAVADKQAEEATKGAETQEKAALARAERDNNAAVQAADQAKQRSMQAAEQARANRVREERAARDRETRNREDQARSRINSRYSEYRSKKSKWERWEASAVREVQRWQDRAIRALPRWARSRARGIIDQANRKIQDINNRAKKEIRSAYSYYKSKKASYLSYRDSKIRSAKKTYAREVSKALNARNSVYNSANSAYNSAKNTALSVRSKAIKDAQTTAAKVKADALKLRDDLKDAAQTVFDEAKAELLKQRDEAIGQATETFESTKAKILTQRDDAIGKIQGRFNALKNEVAEAQSSAIATAGVDTFFAGLGDMPAHMPTDFIRGIRDGCGRDVPTLVDPVDVIADSIGDWHKERMRDVDEIIQARHDKTEHREGIRENGDFSCDFFNIGDPSNCNADVMLIRAVPYDDDRYELLIEVDEISDASAVHVFVDNSSAPGSVTKHTIATGAFKAPAESSKGKSVGYHKARIKLPKGEAGTFDQIKVGFKEDGKDAKSMMTAKPLYFPFAEAQTIFKPGDYESRQETRRLGGGNGNAMANPVWQYVDEVRVTPSDDGTEYGVKIDTSEFNGNVWYEVVVQRTEVSEDGQEEELTPDVSEPLTTDDPAHWIDTGLDGDRDAITINVYAGSPSLSLQAVSIPIATLHQTITFPLSEEVSLVPGSYATSGDGVPDATAREAVDNLLAISQAVENSENGIAIVAGVDGGVVSSVLDIWEDEPFDHVLVVYENGGNLEVAEMTLGGFGGIKSNPGPGARSVVDIANDYDSIRAVEVNFMSSNERSNFIRHIKSLTKEGQPYSFFASGGETCSSVIDTALDKASISNEMEHETAGVNSLTPLEVIRWFEAKNQ